jgi:hypothetical protein
MVLAVEVITELQRRYALDWVQQAPDQEDVAGWTEGSVEAELTFYDGVAAELARGYFERRYSFDFCDAVVNQLYALMISKQHLDPSPPWPKLFWRVYEAFDAGEWHRLANKSDDPIAEFTDPEIAEIVREL